MDMMTHEQFVREWETREHKVRQDIENLRKELDGQYRRTITLLDKTVHEQQAIILKVRESWWGRRLLKKAGYEQ